MLASGNVKESIKMAKVEKEMLESTESETMMNEAAEAEVVDESKFPTLLLKRVRRKGTDGKEYRNYFVFGHVRGRDVEVAFDPKDKGGYRVLDIVYDKQNEADLIIGEGIMTDDKTGKRTKYLTYVARNVDEDGTVWECGVKPSRDSDKSLLLMLLNNTHGGGATA